MIKKFIISIVSTVFLCTVCEMLMPEGKFKKYFHLVVGFVMMCVLMKPFVKDIAPLDDFRIAFDTEISEEELKAESDAYILKLHEENLKNRIKEICGEETEIFIELYADGQVKSITLYGTISHENIKEIAKELGCEDIKVIVGEGDEN